MIEYRTPTREDVVELFHHMRPADRAEVEVVRPQTRGYHLWSAIQTGWEAHAAHENGRVICIFGVGDGPHPGEGIVWMLGTDLLDHHGKTLCRQARDFIARWHRRYAVLRNATDKRNHRVLRWLRWLGFQFTTEVPVNGAPFIFFEKAAPCVTP